MELGVSKMKAILMSIKPKYVADILNGKKTIEIRKKFPSDYVGWVYIYCTKDGKQLVDCPQWVENDLCYQFWYDKNIALLENSQMLLNGKVVARFWCDKVENIKWHKDTAIDLDYYKVVNVIENEEILKASCLRLEELEDYLQIKNAKNIPLDWGITFSLGYAIHITKVEPFDKPKDISEFHKYCDKH